MTPTISDGADYIAAGIGLSAEVFTQNNGQVDDSGVLFYSRSGNVAFKADSVMLYSLVRNNPDPDTLLAEHSREQPAEEPAILGGHALRLSFIGANNVMPRGNKIADWRSNYFSGNEQQKWVSGVANYGEVIYENLWDGIDLVYRTGDSGLKYDFVVRPGADYRKINVRVEGHESLSLIDDSTLSATTDSGAGSAMIDSGLNVFYEDAPGIRLDARFTINSHETYSFEVESPDVTRTMVIDPLIYSSFFGGGASDYGMDITVDKDGFAYVTGYTNSLAFHATPGAFQTTYNGHDSYDAFVMKLSPSGTSLVYSTFLGDAANDYATSIAVDDARHAVVVGYTGSFEFPTTRDAFDTTYNGDTFDAFVTKLSELGDSLVYSTFLGGTRSETGRGIALDTYGYAYVTGNTWSYDLPITPDAYNRAFNGGTTGRNDAFVTKINPYGNSLVYSTFLGSIEYDYSNAIAVDGGGYAYVTGYTRSIGFPTTPGAMDRTLNGGIDAFLTKFSKSGTSLIYSTLLGGDGGESGQCIAVDIAGGVYLSGYTNSENFPTSPDAFDRTHNGWDDAFVARFTPWGDSLAYSTYLGGTGSDIGYSIDIDVSGFAYVTGATTTEDFPTTNSSFDTSHNGNSDAFVTKLSPLGTGLIFSTFLGGNASDSGRGIALAVTGYAFITGDTDSTDFPITANAAHTSTNGGKDIFITMVDLTDPVADPGPDQYINEGQTAAFYGIRSTDNHGIVNYTWTFNDGVADHAMYGIYVTHAFNVPGVYAITLNVSDATHNRGTGQLLLTVLDITPPAAIAGPDQTVNESQPVSFNATASVDNVGIANYTWSFSYANETTYLHGASPVFTFVIPGVYNITLNISDAAGNTDNDSMVVTVNDITPPTAYAGRDLSIYKDARVTFDASGSHDNVGIIDYIWSFNDGHGDFVLHGMTAEHTFSLEGAYVITLKVVDPAGYVGTDTMTVTVLEVISPSADAGPDQVVNELAPMRFDGSASTDNVGVARWVWTFYDGINNATLYGKSPAWTFTVSGTYLVEMLALDAAGNGDTDTMTVTVLDITAPVPNPGPNRVVMQGEAVALDGSSSTDASGIMNHTWAFSYNGSVITLNGPVQDFQFWTPGTYPVTLTVVDPAGNTASRTIVVTVMPPAETEEAASEVPWSFIIMLAISVIMISLAILFRRRGLSRT